MDVNIIVLVKSHSGQRSTASDPNRLACSTGFAPHCLHFLFLPKSLFIFSPCFCVSFDTPCSHRLLIRPEPPRPGDRPTLGAVSLSGLAFENVFQVLCR